MKRTIILLLILTLLTGCGGGTAVTEPTEAPSGSPYAPIGDENTFLLPDLPDIGEYQADELNRWYDGPMPELIPSDEYGELYPYLGRVQEFGGSPIRYYGLCTEDGTLVTDPVYTTVSKADDCYLLSDVGLTGFLENPNTKSSIVKSDGSRILFETDKKLTYVAPDVYMTPGREYLHRDGTPYELQPKGNIIYDNGVMFVISGNRHDVLNSRLEVVQEQIYKDAAGAPGQWIVGNSDNKFFVIDAEGNEIFSHMGYIDYTDGYYYTQEANVVTRLDSEGTPLESVSLPLAEDGSEYLAEVICGHIRTSQLYLREEGYYDRRNVYYTLSGEKTDVTDIDYFEDTDTYVIYRPDGIELRREGRAVTLNALPREGEQITEAVIYEDTAAVTYSKQYGKNRYVRSTLYTADGGEVDVDSYGPYLYSQTVEGYGCRVYTHSGELLYSTRGQIYEDFGSSRIHTRLDGGVLYTYDLSTGKVLVKLHSDTE